MVLCFKFKTLHTDIFIQKIGWLSQNILANRKVYNMHGNPAKETRKRQVRRGISWNAANLVVNKGMSLIVRLLLARLLVPRVFWFNWQW